MKQSIRPNPTITNRSNEKPNENGIKVTFTVSKPVIAEILNTAAIMLPSLVMYLMRPKASDYIFMPPLYEGSEFVAEPLSHPEFQENKPEPQKETAKQIVFSAGDQVELNKLRLSFDSNKQTDRILKYFKIDEVYTVYSAIECGDGFMLRLSGNLPLNAMSESVHSKWFNQVS